MRLLQWTGGLAGWLLCLTVFAQTGASFIQNRGQWPAAVTHRAELAGATIWLEGGAILIDRYDQAAMRTLAHAHVDPTRSAGANTIRHHALRLKFNGADPHSRSTGLNSSPGRYNFILGDDPKRWASDCHAYASVLQSDILPGIDLLVRSTANGVKYDLIVAPGANPELISFTYDGAEAIDVKPDRVTMRTSLGPWTETIPIAYQERDDQRITVRCTYRRTEDGIGFELGAYDKRLPLIIDPSLVFSTYSGSTANNFGYTATFDIAGFLYSGSSAFGQGYPITTGAYDVTFNGGVGQNNPGTDIAITKYDTTGSSLIWSTYIGGSGDDLPHSLIVNDADELILLGTTGSSNYPTTTNAFDRSFSGGAAFTPTGLGTSYPNGSDMVVSRLSSNGATLLASTYLGGSQNDGLNANDSLAFNYADEIRGEVLLDPAGNIIVASCTSSPDFPTTANAYRTSFSGGSHDAVLLKLPPDLSTPLWSTFYGGTRADAAYSAQVRMNGEVVIAGGTTSPDLPATLNAIGPAYHGGRADGLIATFSADGSSLEAATYYGSTAYDQAYFVELDDAEDVYILGQTMAAGGQLISNANYAIQDGGQFLVKLEPQLDVAEWASRFGAESGIGVGRPNISPTAFLVDFCDKIYVSGWGSPNLGSAVPLTTAGLPHTPDAYQSTTDGADFYLAVFDIDMSALTYATYFGGNLSQEHVDGGTSRFDRRGRVYQSVCAGCQNNDDFPTTPDAWSSTNNSSGCNNGVFKFDFDAPLVIAAFDAPDTICGTTDIPFTNLSNGALTYHWNFGDATSSQSPSPTHTFPAPGIYTVTLTAINPTTCNQEDSVTRRIVVYPAAAQVQAMDDTLLCGPISAFTLLANGFGTAQTFVWSSSPAFTDTLNITLNDSIAVVSPAVSGTYYVLARNSSPCFAIDSVFIQVSLGGIALDPVEAICTGDTGAINLIGADPGSTIEWSPEELITSGQGTHQIWTRAPVTTFYFVDVTSPSGCTWSGSVQQVVSPLVASSIQATATPTILIVSGTSQLQAFPSGLSYSWTPQQPLNDPAIDDPLATINATTLFTVNVTDGICTKSARILVEVRELICEGPDIFVPNTFTPNGDGQNDVLYVRGRNISTLEFLVFDRWGEKVFETTHIDRGWDGNYEGKPVDPAVFVYHLTVDCVDGQHYFTKGNVTVVR